MWWVDRYPHFTGVWSTTLLCLLDSRAPCAPVCACAYVHAPVRVCMQPRVREVFFQKSVWRSETFKDRRLPSPGLWGIAGLGRRWLPTGPALCSLLPRDSGGLVRGCCLWGQSHATSWTALRTASIRPDTAASERTAAAVRKAVGFKGGCEREHRSARNCRGHLGGLKVMTCLWIWQEHQG